MKATDIMHPEDAKAIQVLRKLNGLDGLIQLMMRCGMEQNFRGHNLGEMIRVTSTNYPKLHRLFTDVVNAVGIKEPELYVYNDPEMNAYTYGESNTFVALSSSLVEKMTDEELECVMAHECGHILCHHTFYNTLLRTLKDLGLFLRIISYTINAPLLMAMQYWSRKSELSADRCAAAVCGERTFLSTMYKLASGLAESPADPYVMLDQAREYHHFVHSDLWNRIQQNCRIAFNSHPQMCERAWEIDRWKESMQYRKLQKMIKKL